MAVKIRLKRMGKKKQPSYRVVVADSRSPRDGRIIESIGRYDPRQEPSLVEIDNERAQYWLGNGAQPTERAQKLLEISGAVAASPGRGSVYRLETGEVEAKVIPPTPAPEPAAETPPKDTASDAPAPEDSTADSPVDSPEDSSEAATDAPAPKDSTADSTADSPEEAESTAEPVEDSASEEESS